MALPAPGNHNIQTTGGQFLSMAAPGGGITLEPVAIGNNQVWNFQAIGGNVFTIQNVGQNVFAQAGLAADAPVTGGVAMNWALIANGGSFSIRPAANNNFRWGLNGGVVNLLARAGDLVIEDTQRFNIL